MNDIFILFASQFLQTLPALRARCIVQSHCSAAGLPRQVNCTGPNSEDSWLGVAWWCPEVGCWQNRYPGRSVCCESAESRGSFPPLSASRHLTQLSVGAKEREQEISAACRCCADKESTKPTLEISALPPRSSCKPQAESRRCGSGGCSEMTLISINFC